MKARLKGTAAEELPAPYSIKCDCGTEVEGTRNTTSKQTCCPDCMTELFLLPTNVYPSTRSVPSDVISGGLGHRMAVVLKELLPGKNPTDVSEKPSKKKQKAESAEDGTPETEATAPKRKLRLPRINPVSTIRRVFTPLRLLTAGMVLAIAGTLTFMWHQNRLEDARTTWRDSRDAVSEVLEQRDFDQLESVLTNAINAGQILGEDGPEWRRALNMLEETQAVTTLAYATLPVTMSEAGFSQQTTSDNVESLRSLLSQGTYIVDGYIDPAANRYEFTLDIAVMPGQPNVTVSLELPELREYLKGTESNRSVFGFRVADVRRLSGMSGDAWVVQVDPQSFVLLTSAAHCEQLGWSVENDSELSQLLQHQRDFVESSEEWAQRHERMTQQQLAQAEQ